MAFLVDQAQQLCCPLFQAVWKKLGSKCALWDNLRSHFRLCSMRQLYEAILYDLAIIVHTPGSVFLQSDLDTNEEFWDDMHHVVRQA